jgi:tetratricopeptide (TPR) repeat protein
VRSVAKTFRAAFPHVLVVAYPAQPGNLFLFGAARPVVVDLPRLEARLARPAVREDLARIGYASAARLLAVLARREEEGGARDGIPLNTDNRPVVEFEAPRHLQRDRIREVLAALFGERPRPWPEIAPDPEAAMAGLQLRRRIFEAHESLGLSDGAWAAGEEALRADPGDDALRAKLGALCFKAWRDAPAGEGAGRWRDRARAHLATLVERQPLNGPALEQLGDLAAAERRHDEAARRYEEALAAGRRTAANLVAFGTACARVGRVEDAARAFDEAVAMDPDQHRAWEGLADAFQAMGKPDLARDALERWLRNESRPLQRLGAMRRLEAMPQAAPGK